MLYKNVVFIINSRCNRVVSVVNGVILWQVIDLSDIQLMFGSSFYKSLSTGGNVSQALVCTSTVTYIVCSKI